MDAGADTNIDSDADGYCHRNTVCYADCNGHGYCNSDSVACDINTDSTAADCDGYLNINTHANAHSKPNSDDNSYANTESDASANVYAIANSAADPDSHSDTDTCAAD